MKKGIMSVLFGIMGMLAGTIAGAAGAVRILKKVVVERKKLSDKHLALFLAMNQWVNVKQNGKNLASYFNTEGYQRIAIYGMSYMGETLVNELKGTNVEVAYGIDKNVLEIYSELIVVSGEEPLEEVDAIVVTSITYFDEIKESLSSKINCPIISLEDILYEV